MDKRLLNDPEGLKRFFDEQAERNCRRMNAEIDSCGGAFRLRDERGNEFVFAGIENGFPIYRGDRGSKVIYGTGGYEVVEKYATP